MSDITPTEVVIHTGRTPVSERLHNSTGTVLTPADAPANSVLGLVKALHRLHASVSGIWDAAGFIAREDAARDQRALELLSQDCEATAKVLRQMAEAIERIAGVKAAAVRK